MTSQDPIGQAILDFHQGNDPQPIITETNITEPDDMDPAHFFRNFDEMPELEKAALNMCFGKVLDVGCGAGSHSLYLQNQKKLEVVAIDISENAIRTCFGRGLRSARLLNVFDASGTFDSILLLMNGVGIAEKLENLHQLLEKLKSLMADYGQILLDSSDIIYMFDTDDDGGVWIPTDEHYYGELNFKVKYKEAAAAFGWLYVDFALLCQYANAAGLDCELVYQGEHFDFLARLTKAK